MARAGRNGTRRNGADTGSGSNGIDTGGNSNAGRTSTHAIIFFLLSSFLRFTLLLFRLFIFRQVQQQAGQKRKTPDGQDGTYTGSDSNVGRHGERRWGQRVRLLFLSFLLSSFIPICLLPFQLSLFQSSITTSGQDGTDQRERQWQRRTGRGGTGHDKYVFCLLLQFFFLLSSFLLLTFIISFVANYSNRRGEAKWDGAERDGAATAMRDGGQAGGRRR